MWFLEDDNYVIQGVLKFSHTKTLQQLASLKIPPLPSSYGLLQNASTGFPELATSRRTI